VKYPRRRFDIGQTQSLRIDYLFRRSPAKVRNLLTIPGRLAAGSPGPVK